MIKRIFLILIKTYQYVLSPILGPSCRFYPTCSDYAYQSVTRYGLIKGVFIAFKRIVRCHPFSPGGVDPVP
ncbi:MAG: membrane protein insertion efficiency factor YidD [Desulfobacterales bacterium]